MKPNFTFFVSISLMLTMNFLFSQGQDINVTGNGVDIFTGGSNSPSTTNNTDLGDVVVGSMFQATYTIENTYSGGPPSKNQLTVNSITLSGPNAADFSISGISLPTTITRNTSTTFSVTFSSTVFGAETAIISISSNDPNENPYTFNIQGTGVQVSSGPSLTLINTYPLTVLEPSGLAYNKAANELFTVSDNDGKVYRMTTDGTVLQALNYPGSDLEGVSMYKTDKILIAVEGTMEIVEYDYVADNGTFTSHAMNYTYYSTDTNSRIEGVTYDEANDVIYFLNEKNPGALIKADGNFNVIEEYLEPLNHGGDYSASFYEIETGNLWLGSDQTSTIYQCNTDGSIINTFPVTTNSGTPIDKLEGIAIDHTNQLLYAVSDGGQELYVFQMNNLGGGTQTISAVEDTFPTLDGINGETTASSVLDNDTLNGSPATLAEVSLTTLSVLDASHNPTSNIVLNVDGTVTVLPNTSTGDYSLTYEICELLDPLNCSQVTDTISVLGPAPSTSDVIVAGDSWKYYDNGNTPSGSWNSIGYDDSSWSTGNALLGFNDAETTTLNSSVTTAYFRKTVQISNASSITSIDLSAIRDDGMIVYVNGTEVWRDNMPSGTVSYSTEASNYVNGSTTWIYQSISNNLVDGNNVVAVEIHIKTPKGKNKTPDMSFDFAMTTSASSSRVASTKEVSSGAIIYPNPSKDYLNVSIPDKNEKLESVTVFNQFRQKVVQSKSNNVGLSNLKTGIYFVEIKTNEGIYYKTLIIQK